MTPEQISLFADAVQALHKLGIEIVRGTAQPRYEYEVALERLNEMKALVGWTGAYWPAHGDVSK